MHTGITVWWSGVEQRLCFETVLRDLLIIASMFLVKDPPRGLACYETGEIWLQALTPLSVTLPAARLAHGTQPVPASVPSEQAKVGGRLLPQPCLLPWGFTGPINPKWLLGHPTHGKFPFAHPQFT